MTAPHADDFTELTDADIPRVDLVGKAANGTQFLIAKAAQQGDLTNPSLLAADAVRDLIEKATVTDPAAPVEKAELDVTDAPAADELIPDAPSGSTAQSLPGSADWEQLDGDTAMNAVAVLGRLKAVLGWLADREGQEAATSVDPDAAENAWDLDGMGACLDSMIAQLAGFAVGEHMEAETAGEIAKAVASAAEPLAVVEGLAPVVKAGRTLSAANESKIRAAVDSLTGVLNSLPQAPAADDVTKETAVPETPAVEAEPVDVLAKALAALPQLTAADTAGALLAGGRTQEVAKAAGDPQLAVFDADGKLIGTIDPAKLTPIATSPAAADKADEPADDAEQPAEPAAEAPADQPAPDAATIPGTATVQSPPEQDPNAVAKAAALAALEEFLPTLTEEVRKNADLAGVVEELKEQVRKFGEQPDNRRSPILNGAPGVAGGVPRDGSQDDDQIADLRKAADEAKTPAERTTANAALAHALIKGHAAGVAARFTHR